MMTCKNCQWFERRTGESNGRCEVFGDIAQESEGCTLGTEPTKYANGADVNPEVCPLVRTV